VFEAIYNSPWHHPAVAWAAALAAPVLAIALGRTRLIALLIVLEAEIALDAWFTGGWAPLAASSPWAEPLAIAFVVLGDWRFFYLVERQWRPRAQAALVSFLWSLVIPLYSYCGKLAWPRAMADSHLLFFVYEISFVAMALWTGLRARRQIAAGPVARWIARLVAFEVAQYAGWALADAFILGGHDAGYALRVAPNVLYYAAFAPFAVLTAPPEARA
jgi:hypothetical protein